MELLQSCTKPLRSRVSCQKGPTRHAYVWQIGPFWQDTQDIYYEVNLMAVISFSLNTESPVWLCGVFSGVISWLYSAVITVVILTFAAAISGVTPDIITRPCSCHPNQTPMLFQALSPFCTDATSRDLFSKIQHHVEVLEQSTTRVSSRAEVHGAVQQVSGWEHRKVLVGINWLFTQICLQFILAHYENIYSCTSWKWVCSLPYTYCELCGIYKE